MRNQNRKKKGRKRLRIITIGDIVGENGLNQVKEVLPKLKEEYKIDFIIANGENVSGGMGITQKLLDGILNLGVDVVTMGNHTWAKKDIFHFIDHPQLLRPANYSKGNPGKGMGIYQCNGKKVAVINLIGRTDMNVLSENPFTIVDHLIRTVEGKADFIMVDFHAEATAEKVAMGYYLDGRVSALFGTHTHVQTADEKILPKGTAYITDIGMCGPIYSVIGMDVEASTKRFLTSLPERYKLAVGECMFNGCIFEINDQTSRIDNIIRINRT